MAGSVCHTLPVARLFNVLFENPGESSVLKEFLCFDSFAFSRCLLTRSFVCSLVFARLSCFAARFFSLISFALIRFWDSFKKPRIYEHDLDCWLCLCLSLVFSIYTPYSFLSFLLSA